MDMAQFCTCKDHACPMHPVNHNQGCTPCIAKNRRQGEIPSCFFRQAGSGEDREHYTFRDFAELVLRSQP